MELKIKAEGFKGAITMRVANNIERLEVMEKLDVDFLSMVGSSKSKDAQEKMGQQFMTLKNIIGLMKASEEFYVKVDIEKNEKKYKSYADLNDDSDCQAVMMDCATKALIGLGAEVSKKLKS